MKRICYLIWTCICVLCIYSCSDNAQKKDFHNENATSTNNKSESILYPSTENTTDMIQEYFNVTFKGEYQFSEEVYILTDSSNNIDINISYPQIESLPNNESERKINETIESHALYLLYTFKDDKDIEIKTEYEITRNSKDIISIDFTMMFFQRYQAHPWIGKEPITINILTGEQMKLNDIIDIPDNFIDIFLDYFNNCSEYPTESAKEIIELVDIEIKDMMNRGIMTREDFVICDEEVNADYHSYLTEDWLVISIYVPYQIGSYALYKANLTDIIKFLKIPI